MAQVSKWVYVRGTDDSLYLVYFHIYENSDLAEKQNEDNFYRHRLLELLGILNIFEFIKVYDGVYEIIIKVRR